MKKLKRKEERNKWYLVKGLCIIVCVLLFAQGYHLFFMRYRLQSPIKLQVPIVRYVPTAMPSKTQPSPLHEPTATPTPTPTVFKQRVSSFKKYLTDKGSETREKVLAHAQEHFSGNQLIAFDNILKKESGYRADAINEIGAGGICQAYPASKMDCPLDDSGLECQTEWCINYIKNRYGTPMKAWEFHQERNWF